MATDAIPVREFSSVAEMQRHAAEVKARLFAPSHAKVAPVLPAADPVPKPQPKPLKPGWQMPLIAEQSSVRTVAQMFSDVLSIADVVEIVALTTGVTKAQLLSQQRKYDVARARHIVCWLAARHGGVTLNQVGQRLGGRDHTTVLYGVRRVTAVVAALGLDMRVGPHRQARLLWLADWPKIDMGRNGRR